MKRLFNWLAEEGILTVNPAARIKRPRIPDQEPKGIKWDDVQALLATTRGGSRIDLRDRAIICFLADTGCRVRGLCGLKVSDVDLERRRAWVMEKGDQGRFVFFLEGTAEVLREWFEKRPQDQGPWAFVSLGNRSKGALLPEGIAKALRRRAKQAGIEGRVNPHAFRHGFGRHFTLGGGGIGMLSDLMGHSDIGVTKRYYARYNVDELQERHGRYSPMTQLRSCENDDS
jgi:integrase/recombinase XerD